MRDSGLAESVKVIQASSDDEIGGYEIAKKIVQENQATAIVCFNDLQAVGAQAALIESNSKISLVGFDNTYLSGLRQISLTSVDPGNKEIAKKCAELLIADDQRAAKTYFAIPKLIVRDSTKRFFPSETEGVVNG